jgi:cytochrome P450
MFGDGVFTQEGRDWKHSRDILRPQLHYKHYQSLEIFRTAVDHLIQHIQEHSGTVDLQPLSFRLTLDTTTAFLFDESVRSLITSEASGERSFATAFKTAQRWVTNRSRSQGVYWLVDGEYFRQACRDVHQFADKIMGRNLWSGRGNSGDVERSSFLDNLARVASDRGALRGQIINLLAAERDTTACLLSWTSWVGDCACYSLL